MPNTFLRRNLSDTLRKKYKVELENVQTTPKKTGKEGRIREKILAMDIKQLQTSQILTCINHHSNVNGLNRPDERKRSSKWINKKNYVVYKKPILNTNIQIG